VKSLEMNNPEAMGAKEHVEIIKSLEAFRVHPSSKKEP
jgi:hypothetical protein